MEEVKQSRCSALLLRDEELNSGVRLTRSQNATSPISTAAARQTNEAEHGYRFHQASAPTQAPADDDGIDEASTVEEAKFSDVLRDMMRNLSTVGEFWGKTD